MSVEGTERIPKKGGALFLSNHQGNFDLVIFLLGIEGDKAYIAKSEMLKVPVLSSWMKEVHCLFIDRKDLRKNLKEISKGIKFLKSGLPYVAFPEGTRSKGPEVGEFKSGIFKLATKANVPIVPISIDGSYKIMEANKRTITSGSISAIIHPPVATEGLTREEMAELPKKVRDIIVAGVNELQSR
jgi:1-acyl-sn-glycerol-3-phosphate acyltransferase